MTNVRMRHAPKCPDRRVETTASALDATRLTHRCAGCGAVVFEHRGRRSITRPWPSLGDGPEAA